MKNLQKITFVAIALLSHTVFASDMRLLKAFTTGNPSVATIQKLLTIPAVKDSINLQDSNGGTPLMYAIFNQNLPIVKAFLAAGAKTTPQSNQAHYSDTALTIAINAEAPSLPIIKALLHAPDIKESINLQDSIGSTALMYAAQLLNNETNESIVKALITAGAKTTPQLNQAHYSYTALIIAITAQTPSLPIIKNLLNAPDIKESINLQDSIGSTALMYAAQLLNNETNESIVKALITAGAKTTPQSNQAHYSDTALIIAITAQTPSLPIIKNLLNAPDIKESINAQDTTGATALIYAAIAGNEAMVKALAGIKGINANIQDNTGMTALMYAASNNQGTINGDLPPLLKLLVKIPGINLNVINTKSLSEN